MQTTPGRQSARLTARLLTAPIAHRGLHLFPNCPENSLAAFDLAIEYGVPIELDARLLADGKIAVFHDPNLRRMTGRSDHLGRLDAAEMKTLRLRGTAETIPLLEEVLPRVGGRVPLLIEVKNYSLRTGPLEGALVEQLRHYSGDFAVQSFNFASVAWFRRHAPEIARGQLSSGILGIPFHRWTQPDFFAYNLNALPRALPTQVRGSHVPLLAWTIQNPGDREKARKIADNFIFDASDELMAVIAARKVNFVSRAVRRRRQSIYVPLSLRR